MSWRTVCSLWGMPGELSRASRLSCRTPGGGLSSPLYRSDRSIDLLSAPLTIPLVCCYINHFRGAASCGEAMARRRKEERWAGLASRGMVGRLGRCSSRVRHRGIPERERVSDRCHASGVAVDVCSDALAWTQRAARAADGGVGDVSRARSGSPRAPRITA